MLLEGKQFESYFFNKCFSLCSDYYQPTELES